MSNYELSITNYDATTKKEQEFLARLAQADEPSTAKNQQIFMCVLKKIACSFFVKQIFENVIKYINGNKSKTF